MNDKAKQLLNEYQENDYSKLENLLNDLANVQDTIGTELFHLQNEASIATQTIAETRKFLKNFIK